MPKPRLPYDVEHLFPVVVVHIIYSFLPSEPKKSPSLMSHAGQTAIRTIQTSPKLKGKTEMFLYGLDDFVLPR